MALNRVNGSGALNLSSDLELSSFVQYDMASRSVGTNTRLRWTFRPVDDVPLALRPLEVLARRARVRLPAYRTLPDRGPFDCRVVALKDLLDTAGVRTTAASGVFKDRVPADEAEVVHRLRAAGASQLLMRRHCSGDS